MFECLFLGMDGTWNGHIPSPKIEPRRSEGKFCEHESQLSVLSKPTASKWKKKGSLKIDLIMVSMEPDGSKALEGSLNGWICNSSFKPFYRLLHKNTSIGGNPSFCFCATSYTVRTQLVIVKYLCLSRVFCKSWIFEEAINCRKEFATASICD